MRHWSEKGKEVAHMDLMIGDKNRPVGQAFANSMSEPSKGHTLLLGVIQLNLPAKPYTLVAPKVTIEGIKDVNKIFARRRWWWLRPLQTQLKKESFQRKR